METPTGLAYEEALDHVYELLRGELGQALDEQERARTVLANPYSGHADLNAYHYAQGRTSGVAIAMETIDKVRGN